MTSKGRDEGYALLAAVAAIALFSTLSLAVLAQVRTALDQTNAEVERARADLAAQGGAQLAIQNLISSDRTVRWSLDGTPRQIIFGGCQVVIRLIDERSKVPLAALDEQQVRKLFELLGVREDRLEEVTDSYLDWTDDDDDPRPSGAEYAYYAPRHIHPRNASPQSIGELILVRGFDAQLVAKLEQVSTVHFGNGAFDPTHASPLAIAVLAATDSADGVENAPQEIEAAREANGQRTAIDLDDSNIAGRTVEVAVEATTRTGARSRVLQFVELTGNPYRPFTIVDAS